MKKNKFLLITLGVLLVLVIGVSFAYFVVETRVVGNGANTNMTTANLMKVVYDAGSSSLNATNLMPGHSATKGFKVTITPTAEQNSATYGIYLDITSNTFVKCTDANYNSVSNDCEKDAEELIYRIKDSSGNILATGDLTAKTGRVELLKESKTVTSATDFNYTIEIEFKDTNKDQNHNANKTIEGNVVVEFATISPISIPDILATKTIATRTDFNTALTDSFNSTLFSAEDNDGTSYYYAGAVDNNWVKFGDFYWRIIRINGDGTLRLIYNGTTTNQTGSTTQIGTAKFSHKDAYYNSSTDNAYVKDNAYVGYMYGTAGSSTYEATHANTNSSTIKQTIDTWYETNMLGKTYEQYIDTNAGFCGDRTSNTSSSGAPNGTGGYGTTTTYYGAYNRLQTNKTPSLKCTNSNDLYTVSSSNKGNKALTYPVGLISADEVAYAGGKNGSNNTSYYLYTSSYYWTMSPWRFLGGNYAYVFFVDSFGFLSNGFVYSALGVRPVINLKAETLFTKGDGSKTSPFEIA